MAYKIFKAVAAYTIIASIFITGSGVEVGGSTYYWYYSIYILFALFGIVFYRIIDRRVAITACLFVVYAILCWKYEFSLVVKQLVNILFSLVVFYYFLVMERFDLGEVVRKYIVFSKVVLIIGFVQVALFGLDTLGIPVAAYFLEAFPFLKESNISYRFQSITQEPSYIAFLFSPIIFICLCNTAGENSYSIARIWRVLFVIAYLLTLSLVAYVGLLLMVMLIFYRTITVRKMLGSMIFFSLIAASVTITYFALDTIRLRVDDTMYGLVNPIDRNGTYREINLSTYAILSNAYVTKKSLGDQPLTGVGLGNYELAYDKYLPKEMREYWSLNRADANSASLRLITETGLLGFLAFVCFILFNKARFSTAFTPHEAFLWMLNGGIFVMIILILMRSGHYTIHGRMLFLLLYCLTAREIRKFQRNTTSPLISTDVQPA